MRYGKEDFLFYPLFHISYVMIIHMLDLNKCNDCSCATPHGRTKTYIPKQYIFEKLF